MAPWNIPKWVLIPIVAVVGIFVAGFFYEGAAERSAAPEPGMPKAAATRGASTAHMPACEAPTKTTPGYFVVPDHLYHRTGEFTCRVESVISVYEAIDTDVRKLFGGKITSMEITGNDDGRQGTLQCAVSIDKFNDFITYIRKRGKILAERITASSKPPVRGEVPANEEIDERELSLVTVRLMDEKVAKEVGESKGMLAASFSKSTGHFLSGLAVIVEGFGWVAPYAGILIALVLPIVIVQRIRRRHDEAVLGVGAEGMR